jgi:hypothetical protein
MTAVGLEAAGAVRAGYLHYATMEEGVRDDPGAVTLNSVTVTALRQLRSSRYVPRTFSHAK